MTAGPFAKRRISSYYEKMAGRCVVLLLISVAMAGCTEKKRLGAQDYFKQATSSYQSGALDVAIEEYKEMLDQQPFSPYTEEAELRIAHAQYLAGNYAEAVVSFTDFQRRHPTSAHLPFVGYGLGMCYVKQIKSIDRDQTAAQNAEIYFQTVIQQFPDSPFADLSRQELQRCRESLAGHELYIADFYAKRDNQKAAEIRMLTLAARYGETAAAANSLLQLGQIYRRTQRTDEAILAYQALTELRTEGPQVQDARLALAELAPDAEPPARDPIDSLLAANGRKRSTGAQETIKVPGLDTSGTPSMFGATSPLAPPFDPFGRQGGGGLYPY